MAMDAQLVPHVGCEPCLVALPSFGAHGGGCSGHRQRHGRGAVGGDGFAAVPGLQCHGGGPKSVKVGDFSARKFLQRLVFFTHVHERHDILPLTHAHFNRTEMFKVDLDALKDLCL